MTTEVERKWRIGDRLLVDGDPGTVRYVGAVDGVSGEWLGVEWASGDRGRHDGAFKGRRYFKTASALGGSFVRPTKAQRGSALLQALAERYWNQSAEEAFHGHRTQGMASKEIQFVGMKSMEKRQRDPRRLIIVGLDGMSVAEAGSGLELLASLRELDLSINLLTDWEEIFRILARLPSLLCINISQNDMKPWPSDESSLEPEGRTRLRELLANRCNLDSTHWSELTRILVNLEELKVSGNSIHSLPLCGGLEKLRCLDLSLNPLDGWEEVLRLSCLPHLESLNLMATGLSSIQCEEGVFPALRTLMLNGNKIQDWSSVYALRKMAKLDNLMLEPNPVLAAELFRANARQLVLAELPRLRVLDKEEVDAKEIRGAEIDYLKRFGKAWLAAQSGDKEAQEDFQAAHPRYSLLVEKYGAPDSVEMEMAKNAPGGVLSQRLLSLTLVCGERRLSKALPSSMMLRALAPLARRLFKLPPKAQLRFTARTSARPDIPIPLDNYQRELVFYSLESGDTIHVAQVSDSASPAQPF